MKPEFKTPRKGRGESDTVGEGDPGKDIGRPRPKGLRDPIPSTQPRELYTTPSQVRATNWSNRRED